MYELVYPSGKVNFCMTYGLHELPWTYSRISVQELFQPLVIDPQVDFVTFSPPFTCCSICQALASSLLTTGRNIRQSAWCIKGKQISTDFCWWQEFLLLWAYEPTTCKWQHWLYVFNYSPHLFCKGDLKFNWIIGRSVMVISQNWAQSFKIVNMQSWQH